MGTRHGVLEVADQAVWIGVPPAGPVAIPAVGLDVEGVRVVDADGVEARVPWGDVLGIRMEIREQSRWLPGWLLWTGRAVFAAVEIWAPSEADPVHVRLDLQGRSVAHACLAHNRGGYPPGEVRVAQSLVSLLVEFAELRPALRDPERLIEIAVGSARHAAGSRSADLFTTLLKQVRAELSE